MDIEVSARDKAMQSSIYMKHILLSSCRGPGLRRPVPPPLPSGQNCFAIIRPAGKPLRRIMVCASYSGDCSRARAQSQLDHSQRLVPARLGRCWTRLIFCLCAEEGGSYT